MTHPDVGVLRAGGPHVGGGASGGDPGLETAGQKHSRDRADSRCVAQHAFTLSSRYCLKGSSLAGPRFTLVLSADESRAGLPVLLGCGAALRTRLDDPDLESHLRHLGLRLRRRQRAHRRDARSRAPSLDHRQHQRRELPTQRQTQGRAARRSGEDRETVTELIDQCLINCSAIRIISAYLFTADG